MSTRLFCDVCGEHVPRLFAVTIKDTDRFHASMFELEVCQRCAAGAREALNAWVKAHFATAAAKS